MDLNVTWEIQLPETTSEFAPENRPRLAPKRKFIDSKHPFCRCYLLLVSGEGKYEDVVALGRVWLSLQSNPSNLGLLTFPFSISTQKHTEMFFRYHLESSSRNHTWHSKNFQRFLRFHPSLFLVHPSFPPHQLHGNKGLQNADAFQAAHCKEHAQEEQGLNSERSFRFPEPCFLSFHKKLRVEKSGDKNGAVQILLSTEMGKTKFLCVWICHVHMIWILKNHCDSCCFYQNLGSPATPNFAPKTCAHPFRAHPSS